jgi:hypothetical protein
MELVEENHLFLIPISDDPVAEVEEQVPSP